MSYPKSILLYDSNGGSLLVFWGVWSIEFRVLRWHRWFTKVEIVRILSLCLSYRRADIKSGALLDSRTNDNVCLTSSLWADSSNLFNGIWIYLFISIIGFQQSSASYLYPS